MARAAVRLLERMPAGSGAPKLYWRYRHLVDGSEWIEGYFDSQDDPRRHALVAQLLEVADATSYLEVGCSSGANLAVLAAQRPTSKLFGVDINPRAIEIGGRRFAETGVTNVTLRQGAADDMAWLSSRSVDVAFTDAVLMYVAPQALAGALDEMVRVASRVLILNEFLAPSGESRRLGGSWAHDYPSWARARGFRLEIGESPRGSAGGDWSTFGRLITVHLV